MLNQRKKNKEETPVIEVKNVTKKYGSFVAVDDISFTINDGEVVGFLGPNGAGKSTTMNMITGYIEQTEGNIIVDGFDTLKKSKKAKKEIGYMPEGVPLYTDLTVKEFVTYMAELRKVDRKTKKENVQKVLKETGLDQMQNKLIKNLSRGQKQRVSLAGTLVADPKILILDEPTVGLDPKQITEIRSLIKNLGKKHTVILSSHILSEVSQICDRVIIINKGKIVAIDTPENLEKKVSDNNIVYVTVEDKENKIDGIKEKITGIKEIKLIKENKYTRHIPLIIISAKISDQEQAAGLNIGADAYLTKPFSPTVLLSVVNRLMTNQRELKEYFYSPESAYQYTEGQLLHQEDKEFLDTVTSIIKENVSKEGLGPELVADALNINTRILYRRFKKISTMTPSDFIKDYRLNYAAQLLVNTNMSVQEIIYNVGISNKSYFYREFARKYNMTPKEYRTKEA